MIRTKSIIILSLCLFAACHKEKPLEAFRTVTVEKKNLQATVQAMAEIQPLNKVEILPPVSGRIDSILVQEGTAVKKAQELARISSSDRAALLDAARSKGPEEFHYWEGVYRPTPILAPVPGKVIQVNIVPGQTISTTTVLFDLSDRLIFRAKVDETDIRNIHTGTPAQVVVDAFPDRTIMAKTRLVREQSQLVNNVNIYEVELDPDSPIEDLRAGMTATVTFIYQEKPEALFLPLSATNGLEQTTISVDVELADGKTESRKVTLGRVFGSDVEVVAGLLENEQIRVARRQVGKESAPTSFMPFGKPAKTSEKKP